MTEPLAGEPLALIIEDDADLAEIFSSAIQRIGFQTEVISAGDRALDRLAQVEPGIIVLDLHLPHVDGLQILKQIRADARLQQTRVIVASADARMAELADKLADLVLLKPVAYSQLRELASRLAFPPHPRPGG